MKIGIVDANNRTAAEYKEVPASIVSQWIEWEAKRAGVFLVDPREADVVFLVFAGAVGWRAASAGKLRSVGIVPDRQKRGRRPYIITGGAIFTAPMTALHIADAVAVGEAYALIRKVFELSTQGAPVDALRNWIRDYPHAIEADQVEDLARDPERPWLLARPAALGVSPDPRIDWSVPPIKTDDRVVRISGSKGCHFKCFFCSTSWCQPYAINPNGAGAALLIRRLTEKGERVQIMSNDPANIPWFQGIHDRLDHGSYTIHEVRSPLVRARLVEQKAKIVRFGVEGLTERVRKAVGKPIPEDELIGVIQDLNNRGVNTHAFYIVGLPFEREADWIGYRKYWERLSKALQKGIHRVKYTAYTPCAPAPAHRFLGGSEYEARYKAHKDWMLRNSASRHILSIDPKMTKSRAEDVADLLSIPKPVALALCSAKETTVLAETEEDYARMTSELIEWPFPRAKRFAAGEAFRRRMMTY